MLSIRVEVFSDTLCPWCYIGKKYLDQAIYMFRQQHPNVMFEVEWKPLYLYPNLERTQGQPKTRLLERIRPEIQNHIVQAGLRAGINFQLSAGTTGPSAASHALLKLALQYSVSSAFSSPSPTTSVHASSSSSGYYPGVSPGSNSMYSPSPVFYPQSRLLDALFAAHFERGQDISSPGLLIALAEESGVSRQDAQHVLSNNLAIRETDIDAAYSGTRFRGTPTFIIQGRWLVGGMEEPEVFLGVFERAAQEEMREKSGTRENSLETVEGAASGRSRRGMSVREMLINETAP